jgi:hypothetical protein
VKRLPYSRLNLAPRTEPPLVSNAKSGEPESGGRDACLGSLAPAIGVGPVANQAGVGVRFIPEEVECRTLQFIQ